MINMKFCGHLNEPCSRNLGLFNIREIIASFCHYDRSAKDAYSPAVPYPTSGVSRGLCKPDLHCMLSHVPHLVTDFHYVFFFCSPTVDTEFDYWYLKWASQWVWPVSRGRSLLHNTLSHLLVFQSFRFALHSILYLLFGWWIRFTQCLLHYFSFVLYMYIHFRNDMTCESVIEWGRRTWSLWMILS
jgi:hypothetical protein